MTAKLYSVGDILKELQPRVSGELTIFNLQYVLSKLHIEPVQQPGRLRLFDEAQVELIYEELKRIRGSISDPAVQRCYPEHHHAKIC